MNLRAAGRRVGAVSMCILFGCGTQNDEVVVGEREEASWTGPLFHPRVTWKLTRAPVPCFSPELVSRLEGSTVLLRGEALPSSAWKSLPPSPSRSDLRVWTCRPRHSTLTREGEMLPWGRLDHPERELRLVQGLTGVGPNSFGLLPDSVHLVLEAKDGSPDDRYTLDYLSSPEQVLGTVIDLLGDREAMPRVQEVILGKDCRPAVLLPPPGVIEVSLQLPEAPRLRFGYALRDRSWKADEGGVRESENRGDGVGFSVSLVDESGVTHPLWHRFLSPEEGGRFHETTLDLDRWSSRNVRLSISTYGSEGGHDASSPGDSLDDLAYVSAPFITSRTAPARSRPNVLVILIDTLRTDALGCYGNPRDLSPNLDAFASQGLVFEQARSPYPATLPSHVSLFTSLHPVEHGIFPGMSRVMPSEYVTLAETLGEHGWQTGAFTDAGYVIPAFGLADGFDRFDVNGGGVDAVAERAWEWISTREDPYFCFLHTYEVHTPYDPPEPFRSRLVARYEGPLGKVLNAPDLEKLMAGDSPPTASDVRYAHDLYEAGVAYTDRVLGDFLTKLREHTMLDETIVIVTSDHGEEFFDHGDFLHGHTLYEELLRIPLLVRFPPAVATGQRVQYPVELIDVAPGIMQLLDLPVPQTWSGQSLFDESAQRIGFASLPQSIRGGQGQAVYEGNLKWIRTSPDFYREHEPPNGVEVFDLSTDPEEQRDVTTPDRDSMFVRLLENLLEAHPERFMRSQRELELTGENEMQLKALGY